MPTDFWKCVPSLWRSWSSALSQRATVALFHQVTAWRRSAEAAAYCSSLQHVVTLSTIHSGLFCSKNALIYTFWGLLLNDETFNVCKFWKWGSQWNKVVFFGESWVFFLSSHSPEHMKQAPTGPPCRNNVDWVKPANPKCHYCNARSDQMKHFGCIIHNFRFYLNSVWTFFHVDKRHD